MRGYFSGDQECFDCGYVFHWEGEVRRPAPGTILAARELPEVEADVCAVGNDDGKVKYEVVGRCPNCRVKNKFNYEP